MRIGVTAILVVAGVSMDVINMIVRILVLTKHY